MASYASPGASAATMCPYCGASATTTLVPRRRRSGIGPGSVVVSTTTGRDPKLSRGQGRRSQRGRPSPRARRLPVAPTTLRSAGPSASRKTSACDLIRVPRVNAEISSPPNDAPTRTYGPGTCARASNVWSSRANVSEVDGTRRRSRIAGGRGRHERPGAIVRADTVLRAQRVLNLSVPQPRREGARFDHDRRRAGADALEVQPVPARRRPVHRPEQAAPRARAAPPAAEPGRGERASAGPSGSGSGSGGTRRRSASCSGRPA